MTGIAPCIWGPITWELLHILSFNYPEKITNENLNVKTDMLNFLTSLGKILPCEVCRKHFFENIKSMNLNEALNSRESFTKFMYNLHDLVNKQTGKQSIPFEEVFKKYDPLRSGTCGQTLNVCSNDNKIKSKVEYYDESEYKFLETKNVIIILLCIILFCLIFYIYYSKTFPKKK